MHDPTPSDLHAAPPDAGGHLGGFTRPEHLYAAETVPRTSPAPDLHRPLRRKKASRVPGFLPLAMGVLAVGGGLLMLLQWLAV